MKFLLIALMMVFGIVASYIYHKGQIDNTRNFILDAACFAVGINIFLFVMLVVKNGNINAYRSVGKMFFIKYMLAGSAFTVLSSISIQKTKKLAIDMTIASMWCFVSLLIVLFFSRSSSLFQNGNYGGDAAVYSLVGKLWHEGIVPYKGIIEHHPPLMFLYYRLAYFFNDNRLGLFCIETVSDFIMILLCYTILRRRFARLPAIGLTFCTLAHLVRTFDEGNLAEEYTMPFVLISILLCVIYFERYEKNGTIKHPIKFGFLYGLLFGIICMISPNCSVILCAAVFIIVLNLIIHREFGNVFANGIMFIAGVCVIIIPFVIYFYMHDALDDLAYNAIIFNSKYAKATASGNWGRHLKNQTPYNFAVFLLPVLLSFLQSARCGMNRKYLRAAFLVFAGCAVTYVTMSGACYRHYYMICMPLIPLSFVFSCTQNKSNSSRINISKVPIFIAYSIFILGFDWGMSRKFKIDSYHVEHNANFNNVYRKLVSYIPESEYDKVIGYSIHNTECVLYLITDILPKPYSAYGTESWARIEPEIIDEYIEFLKTSDDKWLIMTEQRMKDKRMREILKDEWELYQQVKYNNMQYSLYKKIEEKNEGTQL